MSLVKWICIVFIVIGIVLFLYGANFYNGIVGWVGLYLFLLGFFTLLVLYIYGELTKKTAQNP